MSGTNSFKRNAVRIAEVWMDEYKTHYYNTIGKKLGEFGDVTDRKNLRNKLQCKSFQWYLHTIYPELKNPDDAIAQGWVG